jgi:hypothetical protein
MTDEMDGTCSPILEMKTVHQIVVGSPAGKRGLGRRRNRLVDNIKVCAGKEEVN